MLTRLPLSLMVELAVDCSTKYSVPNALMKSGGGLSSAIALCLPEKQLIKTILPQNSWADAPLRYRGDIR
jgi:hypothetical protein